MPRCTTIVHGKIVRVEPLPDGRCPEIGRAPIDPALPEGSASEDGDSSPDVGDSVDDSTGGSSFFIPDNDENLSPQNGSLLGDIYFEDERTLEEEGEGPDKETESGDNSSNDNWQYALIALLVLFLVPLLAARKRQPGPATSSNDANDGDGGDATRSEYMPSSQRRNKDKMIATVLVDLRINDPHLGNFRDVLVQRGSETDRSMTDTDPGSFVPWEEQNSRDLSFEPSVLGSDGFHELPPALRTPVNGVLPSLNEMGIPTTATTMEENRTEIPTATILDRPQFSRGSASIRRRFFRRRNPRAIRSRSSATGTLRL